MPTFFFDCIDGERHFIDEYDIGLVKEVRSRDHSLVMLARSFLADTFPNLEERSVAVTICASGSVAISVARRKFTVYWMRDRIAALDRIAE